MVILAYKQREHEYVWMRGIIDLMFPSLKRLMFRVCDTHDVDSFFGQMGLWRGGVWPHPCSYLSTDVLQGSHIYHTWEVNIWMCGFIDLMFPSSKLLIFRVCDTHDVDSFFELLGLWRGGVWPHPCSFLGTDLGKAHTCTIHEKKHLNVRVHRPYVSES